MSKKLSSLIFLIFIILILVCFFYVLKSLNINVFNSSTISTQNAYIKSNISNVNPSISSSIKDIYVSDFSKVKKGDLLFKLDCFNYENKQSVAQTTLEAKQGQLEKLLLQKELYETKLLKSKISLHLKLANLKNKESEFLRSKELFEKKAISKKTYYEALTQYLINKDEYELAKIDLDAMKIQIKTIQSDIQIQQSEIQNAKNNLNLATNDVSKCEIRASEDGSIGEILVGLNDYVSPAKTLTKLISAKKYLVANMKENLINKVKIGDEVEFSVDANNKTYKGKIIDISGASGNELSFMKLDNSVGNFIKITQRIAIKIEIINDDKNLISGMSAYLHIK